MTKAPNGAIAHLILDMGNGGAERLVRNLSQKLRMPGIANMVVCFDKIHDHEKEFATAGVPLLLIPRRPKALDFSVIPRLLKVFRRHNVKLVHAHDLSALAYGLIAGKLTGADVIMTEHSRHYVDVALKRRIEKSVLVWSCGKLVSVSRLLREKSIRKEKIPPGKITVIENGVDTAAIENTKPADIRAQQGFSREDTLVLVAGRLEPIKGQQHLIAAMAHNKLKGKKIQLLLAGVGSAEASFKKLAQELKVMDRVRFLGFRPDIYALMKACDILVIPSESEGLPFSLLEAMAARIPVIATRVGQIPEILGSRRGWLVAPFSSGELAGAIEQILCDPVETAQKVAVAFSFCQKNYSQRRMFQKYEALYRSRLH